MTHIVYIPLAPSEKENGTNRKLRQTNTKKLPDPVGFPCLLVTVTRCTHSKRLKVAACVPIPCYCAYTNQLFRPEVTP